MKRSVSAALAGTALTALAAGSLAGTPASATPRPSSAPWVKALTSDGKLVAFQADKPRGATVVGTIRGLEGDRELVGMDYRAADGKLYAVGDAGGLYVVSTRSAVVTKVGRLTVALEGTAFGVDFNPAADRLRVVSDTGQNLRHDPNPGGATIVDTPLNTPPATGATAGVDAAAYTNNDTSADTATLLFDIDSALDQVVAQVPANSGTLNAVGALGVKSQGPTSFDVLSTVTNGRAVANQGYATLTTPRARPAFYRIDLTSGKASFVGAFPAAVTVESIAVQLDR